jgi:hypothetical protein
VSSEIDLRETEWAVSVSRRTVLRAINLPYAVRPLSKYVKKILCFMDLVKLSHKFDSVTSQPPSYHSLCSTSLCTQFRYFNVPRSRPGWVYLKGKYSTPGIWRTESSDFFDRGRRCLTHIRYRRVGLWWHQGHNIVETFRMLLVQLWKCKCSLEKLARARVCVCTGRLRILQSLFLFITVSRLSTTEVVIFHPIKHTECVRSVVS